MMNPTMLFKLKGMKDEFVQNHPGFAAFFRNEIASGVPEGSVIEITITKPGEEPVTTNMKVNAKDMELMQAINSLS